MTPVRLGPTALQSRVKHFTTEPLRSLIAYAQKPPIYTLADKSHVARGFNFFLSLHLLPYAVYVRKEGLASVCFRTDSPEPSLLIKVINTKISNADPNMAISIYFFWDLVCLLKSNGKLQNKNIYEILILKNSLAHLCQTELPVLFKWTNLFRIKVKCCWVVIYNFIQILKLHSVNKQYRT